MVTLSWDIDDLADEMRNDFMYKRMREFTDFCEVRGKNESQLFAREIRWKDYITYGKSNPEAQKLVRDFGLDGEDWSVHGLAKSSPTSVRLVRHASYTNVQPTMPKLSSSLKIFASCLVFAYGTHASPLSTPEGTCPLNPWSHPPRCLNDYCVYTSIGYNSHHGISFIALESTEPTLLPLVHDVTLTERGRHHLYANPDLPYEIRELPGRGRGVFARRRILRGEVFMVGFPAVVVDQEFENLIRDEELYRLAYERLGVPKRALSLAASSGGSVYEDIMKTNAFGVGVGGRRYSGLYPEVAMMNHDCWPSSIVRFSSETLANEAVAVRDVNEGEELTISYIPADLPTSERVAMLQLHYKFQCSCQLCSAPARTQNTSDARRERIAEIRTHLVDATDKESARRLADELLQLVDDERLGLRLKEYYNELITVFHRLGDVESTLKFAEAALQWAEELSGGVDDKYQRAIRGSIIALGERLQNGNQ
ncbi:hypothetical protein OQA88_8997 [Cercophora sp. LCS_1]